MFQLIKPSRNLQWIWGAYYNHPTIETLTCVCCRDKKYRHKEVKQSAQGHPESEVGALDRLLDKKTPGNVIYRLSSTLSIPRRITEELGIIPRYQR